MARPDSRRGQADFQIDRRQLAVLSILAIFIGGIGGLAAWVLLRLIGLITHIAYRGDVGWSLVAPTVSHWGIWTLLIPVIGGLIVGMMARFGTQKIRGHGIPEAVQEILENQSRLSPRVALWKPLASAITIGTGGPFGAEGPIIMTGGALGSLVAQRFNVSAAERRVLLVSGASAGMSAVFGAPLAAVLLAVEFLLFEWRPRSFMPVVVASIIAYLMRHWLIGTTPVFGTGPLVTPLSARDWVWAAVLGAVAGILATILSKLVYLTENLYHRLPIHWMWWPALGGLFVGVGGLVDPVALGVGYPTIRLMDGGRMLLAAAALLLVVKSVIWIISLSSGTSGGVLAPLLMIGGAMGTLAAFAIPGHLTEAWATIGMGSVLAGGLQMPLMAIVFTVETTHNWTLLLPLVVACVTATVVTMLWTPHSILTEKIARRGVLVPRDYTVHPLQLETVAEIMTPLTMMPTFSIESTIAGARILSKIVKPELEVLPVVGENGRPVGAVRLADLVGYDDDDRETLAVLTKPVASVKICDFVQVAVERLAHTPVAALMVLNEKNEWIGWVVHRDILKTWRRQVGLEEKSTE